MTDEFDATNEAFRDVLNTPAGKRVLFWMLEQCSIYGEAFASENTNATNYMLGLQAGGRRLIAKLDELDPRFYPKLLLDVSDIRAMERAATERAAEQEDKDDAP